LLWHSKHEQVPPPENIIDILNFIVLTSLSTPMLAIYPFAANPAGAVMQMATLGSC